MLSQRKFRNALVVALMLLFIGSCAPAVENDAENFNTVSGYPGNSAPETAIGVTIAGGWTGLPNRVSGDFAVVGGGIANLAGESAVVSGGSHNLAERFHSTVAGGEFNQALRVESTIGGGTNNRAAGARSTIGGGAFNRTGDYDATVCGGAGNLASGRHSTVCGGIANTASGLDASIAGGSENLADGAYASVNGGKHNRAVAFGTAIGGGTGNQALARNGSLAGGFANQVLDDYSTVAGGSRNLAGSPDSDVRNARFSTVGGGADNQAGGLASTVPGGLENFAGGDYSFAAGRGASVAGEHPGTFLFSDSAAFPFRSLSADEFAVRAGGGVRFVSSLDAAGNPLTGVYLAPGEGAWSALSDRSAKTDIMRIDNVQILEKLAALPLSTWQYRGSQAQARHIGPMAQDFYAAFGLGGDERYISSVDADGVALASIQGLYALVEEQDRVIQSQQTQIAGLEARLSHLEQRLVYPRPDWLAILGGSILAFWAFRKKG